MRQIVLAAILLASPCAAFAQQPPQPAAPVCIPASLANAIHLFFGQGKSDDDMLVEAAGQNLTNAIIADAKNTQKVQDDAITAKAITDAIVKAKADQKAADAAGAAKVTAEPPTAGSAAAPAVVAPGAAPATAAPKAP